MGGEDIHIGLYQEKDEAIKVASRRTVEVLCQLIDEQLAPGAKVVDLGAGFGGSARYLVKNYEVDVTCLNLSRAQNAVNESLNQKAQLAPLIRVDYGNFEKLSYPDQSFDVVWSQDAFLHSAHKEDVLKEAFRVLKPGGVLVFTDPMQDDQAKKAELQPVLDRIHLDSLASPEVYQAMTKKLGFSDCCYYDHSHQLTTHYRRVLEELEQRRGDLKHCSEAYLEKMKKGLHHWINAGEKNLLRWGFFAVQR